jgi:hypothetical protein
VRLLVVRSAHARAFYESEALRGGWTIRQLDRQIQSQFYERTALSRDKAALLGEGDQSRASDNLTPDEEIKVSVEPSRRVSRMAGGVRTSTTTRPTRRRSRSRSFPPSSTRYFDFDEHAEV